MLLHRITRGIGKVPPLSPAAHKAAALHGFLQQQRVALAERVTVIDPKSIMNAKKAIRKGFEFQKNKQGFSIIEVLSTCPTNWGKTPVEALERLKNEMIPYYPLGVFKEGAVR